MEKHLLREDWPAIGPAPHSLRVGATVGARELLKFLPLQFLQLSSSLFPSLQTHYQHLAFRHRLSFCVGQVFPRDLISLIPTSQIQAGLSCVAATTRSLIVASSFSSLASPFFLRAGRSAALGQHSTAWRVSINIQCRFYAKSNKMPPKKVVQEEKIPLGRPGNNLKSGIVSPVPKSRYVFRRKRELTEHDRLVLQMSANPHCSKPSQRATLATQLYEAPLVRRLCYGVLTA